MSRDDASQNPFASPLATEPIAPSFEQHAEGPRLTPMAVSHVALDGRVYALGAIVEPWHGSEKYTVDGYLQTKAFSLFGRRKMTSGQEPRHAVDIHVNPFGARRLFIDGQLVNDDVFPELKGKYRDSGLLVHACLLLAIAFQVGLMCLSFLPALLESVL